MFGMVGTAWAVLLAFVVFAAFESYADAKAGADREASALVELSRTAAFFPTVQRDAFDGLLLCYGRAVVNLEWQTMRYGRRNPAVTTWARRIAVDAKRLSLRTPRRQVAFGQLLQLENQRMEGRRTRIAEAHPTVPLPLWVILVAGGAVNVLIVLMFTDRRERAAVQALIMAFVAAMVTGSLLIVWFLDHPYGGHTGSIKPDGMSSVTIVQQERPGLAPPCSPVGSPA
jgi:hypothetical protein